MNAFATIAPEQKLDFNERSDGSPAWLQRALSAIDASTLWRYPDRSVLEKTLAARYGVNADQVLVCNGGDEGIDLILRVAAKDKRTLILPLPAFSMYKVTAARNDVTVKTVAALPENRLDIQALLAAIGPNQLIALTSPNNPTGEIISIDDARAIAEKARQYGSLVLFDAAYAEFNRDDYSVALAKTYDNVVALRSFSKVYGMAALRVGYLIAAQNTLQAIRSLTPPFNVSGISLALAQAALSSEAQTDQVSYVAAIQKNLDRVRTRLLSFGIAVAPSAGNFLLLALKPKQADLLRNVLQQNNIRVRCFSEAELQGCVRITIPLDCTRLLQLLELTLKPQLLCLDMDGVLIDTRDSYDCCVAETITTMSGKPVSRENIQLKRNSGGFNDDWKLTQTLLADQLIDVSLDRVIETFQALYEGENGYGKREKVMVDNRSAGLLRQYRTAVVTGRPANEALDGTHRLPWTVDALVSRDDVQQLKPDPEGIRAMQQRFKTASCWMFGDTVDDMRAARAAGAVAIGVGRSNEAALTDAGAHLVIDNINEVVDLL